jgi:hypothetical protein
MRPQPIVFAALALVAACGGDRRSHPRDGGTPADGDLPPTDGGRTMVPDGSSPTDGEMIGMDGAAPDGGSALDAGPGDAGVDRSERRITIPFSVMSFDVDASGRIVAAGRDTVGGDPYLALHCAGPPGRTVRMAEETPSSALVRVDPVTGDIYVIYSATAGGATAYAIRWIRADCDAAGSPPAELFDSEYTPEGFVAEVPLALDVSSGGDAFVVSEYAGTYRLTRYLGGSRREQRELDSPDPARLPSLGISLALDRATGTGALVAAPFRSLPAQQLYVRRFGPALSLDPGWTAIPGTEAVSFGSQDAISTESGVLAIWWAARVGTTTTLQRMLTTITPTDTVRAQWTIGGPLASVSPPDTFVRERGTVDDIILVDRQAGAVARYTLDGAAVRAPITSPVVRGSDVAADAAERSYVLEGREVIRNRFVLP